MATTVFDVLSKNIGEDHSSAIEFLIPGGAQDFAGYKEMVGLIRGLETSQRYVEDLSRKYMDDNDD